MISGKLKSELFRLTGRPLSQPLGEGSIEITKTACESQQSSIIVCVFAIRCVPAPPACAAPVRSRDTFPPTIPATGPSNLSIDVLSECWYNGEGSGSRLSAETRRGNTKKQHTAANNPQTIPPVTVRRIEFMTHLRVRTCFVASPRAKPELAKSCES